MVSAPSTTRLQDNCRDKQGILEYVLWVVASKDVQESVIRMLVNTVTHRVETTQGTLRQRNAQGMPVQTLPPPGSGISHAPGLRGQPHNLSMSSYYNTVLHNGRIIYWY